MAGRRTSQRWGSSWSVSIGSWKSRGNWWRPGACRRRCTPDDCAPRRESRWSPTARSPRPRKCWPGTGSWSARASIGPPRSQHGLGMRRHQSTWRPAPTPRCVRSPSLGPSSSCPSPTAPGSSPPPGRGLRWPRLRGVRPALPVPHATTGPQAKTGAPSPRQVAACLGGSDLHESVTYQPADHYWPLQWAETAIYLALALALAASCAWGSGAASTDRCHTPRVPRPPGLGPQARRDRRRRRPGHDRPRCQPRRHRSEGPMVS